jgi:ParB family chromosome partitioning protein
VHGAPPAVGPSTPARWQGVSKSRNAAEIPVDRIGPDPDQPREEFEPEALRRLADSLKSRGQIQPISVRWVEERGQYVIVCGERRWRAATLAGLTTMACVVLDRPIPPGELLAMQLVENLLREDLKPVEQAKAYRTLMEQNGWSTRQVARELSVAQPQVVRALALLNLPADVQEAVEEGALAPATAYEIGKLGGQEEQRALAERVVAEKLTRQEAVEAVRTRKEGRAPADPSRPAVAEFRVSEGVTVSVKYRKPDRLSVVQALRLALKQAQSAERDGDQEAA